ncbi:hypothetical protein PT974_01030 [Cladobotryum mycophilum]|uniref:AB hydrolase-1 domain-containing protein n=1 Tax=Cladobotryum mycophilum TaxID=491253 RepID=A0ABR0T2S3_9HYPO
MTTYYALDGPINDAGGPEHTQQALQGIRAAPSNYRFVSDDGTRLVYHPIMDSGEVTLVVIQPRGTWPSDKPEDELRMSSKHMAADIDALRRHLGRDAIIVLGHSNGAAIALSYAEQFPSRCSKAILIQTQLIGFPDRAPIIAREVERRQSDPRYADAVAKLKATPLDTVLTSDEHATEWLGSFFDLYFVRPDTGRPEFALNTGPLNIRHWAYMKQNAVDNLPEASHVEDLDKVTADTLIIISTEDFICSVEESKYIQAGIGANAKLIVYDECGHMPWIEKKDDFYRDLMAFLLQ